ENIAIMFPGLTELNIGCNSNANTNTRIKNAYSYLSDQQLSASLSQLPKLTVLRFMDQLPKQRFDRTIMLLCDRAAEMQKMVVMQISMSDRQIPKEMKEKIHQNKCFRFLLVE